MANNTISGPRTQSTSIPVQTSVGSGGDGPAPAATGFAGESSLIAAVAAKTVDGALAGATRISDSAERVAGASLTVAGAATNAARAESRVKSTIVQGGKTLGQTVGNVKMVFDDDADMGERIDAAKSVGTTAKEFLLKSKAGTKVLTATVMKNVKVAGYGAGAVAGAFNVAKNANEIGENSTKAWENKDPKALLDAVNNGAQIASGAARVVNDVTEGAKLLKLGGEKGSKIATKVATSSALGVALKAAPIVGAAIGSAKAAVDMYKNPSIENGLKLAANLVGLIPIPGASIASAVAVAALENPKVMAMAKGAVQSAGRAISSGMATMSKKLEGMEPLRLAM